MAEEEEEKKEEEEEEGVEGSQGSSVCDKQGD